MNRTAQKELIRKLRTLTAEEAQQVQAFMSRLKSGLPTADQAADRAAAADRPVAAAAAEDSPAKACSFWGRRPLHTVREEQFQPIAALLREALDERDARRQRFG